MSMPLASSIALPSQQQSFLRNTFASRTHSPKSKIIHYISCKSLPDGSHDSSLQLQLGKVAAVTLAAVLLNLSSVGDSFAAKSGGRVGGQAFRSSAPKISNNNSRRTNNIYVNPQVAPPLVGGGYGYGYGYGYGVPYYGGWSPFSFFGPAGTSIGVGIGGGFDTLILFMLLGTVATVVRRFTGPRDDDDDE